MLRRAPYIYTRIGKKDQNVGRGATMWHRIAAREFIIIPIIQPRTISRAAATKQAGPIRA